MTAPEAEHEDTAKLREAERVEHRLKAQLATAERNLPNPHNVFDAWIAEDLTFKNIDDLFAVKLPNSRPDGGKLDLILLAYLSQISMSQSEGVVVNFRSVDPKDGGEYSYIEVTFDPKDALWRLDENTLASESMREWLVLS